MTARICRPVKVVSTLVAVALVVALTGCSDPGPPLYKVTGKVTVDGDPAVSAMIIFTAEDGANSAAADLSAGGEYEMTTGGVKSGLAPGKYTVQLIGIDAGSVEEGEQEGAPCNVPAKYAETATSELTAVVKEEDNVINFPLTSE